MYLNYKFTYLVNSAVLLIIIFIITYVGFQSSFFYISDKRIKKVHIEGNLNDISKKNIYKHISPLISSSSFFTIKFIDLIKKIQDEIQFISKIRISRLWPDEIIIQVEETPPIAFWCCYTSLLNKYGQIFMPKNIEKYKDLPLLYGGETHKNKILKNYYLFSNVLYPLGLSIKILELSKIGSWSIQTNNNIKIFIGRTQVFENLVKFVNFYEKIIQQQQMGNIKKIDFRYTNALAVTSN